MFPMEKKYLNKFKGTRAIFPTSRLGDLIGLLSVVVILDVIYAMAWFCFLLLLTLNGKLKVAEFCVSRRICSSVDHGMISLRKHVWWCYLRVHSNVSLIVICSFNWSPGHCCWGFSFIRGNTLCRWTGFAKWRRLNVFKQNNNMGIKCLLLDLRLKTYIDIQVT